MPYIGSTPTFLYFDLYLYSAYAAHYVYFTICMFLPFAVHGKISNWLIFSWVTSLSTGNEKDYIYIYYIYKLNASQHTKMKQDQLSFYI